MARSLKHVPPVILKACRLQLHAYDRSDRELLRELHRFVRMALQANQLLEAFRKSRSGIVGVAQHLHLSRPSIYIRIEELGLEAADFRRPDASMEKLINASRAMRGLAKKIQRLREI